LFARSRAAATLLFNGENAFAATGTFSYAEEVHRLNRSGESARSLLKIERFPVVLCA